VACRVDQVGDLDTFHAGEGADVRAASALRPATADTDGVVGAEHAPEDFVPAIVIVAALARADLRNVRRVWRVMGGPFVKSK